MVSWKSILIIALVFLIQKCSLIRISVSKHRPETSPVLEVDQYLSISASGAVRINKSDFFPASFKIIYNGKIIYIDPLYFTGTEKADWIFISHAHYDHLSFDDLKRLTKPETRIVCPVKVAARLRKPGYKIVVIKPGDNIDLEGIRCEAVPAYNLHPVFLGIKAHPQSAQNVGYVLTFDSKYRLFHAGDSDYIPEMNALKNITVALIPVGGDNLTMDLYDAIQLINKIKPKIFIPMHYELKQINRLNEIEKEINPETQVLFMP